MNIDEILNGIKENIQSVIHEELNWDKAYNTKAHIESMMRVIAERTGNSDLKFCLTGHPLKINVIDKYIDWQINEGDNNSNIKLDYSYGKLKDTNYDCNVISTTKMDKELVLSLIEEEQTKIYKYSFEL